MRLLKGKNAIIMGAKGALGTQVAHQFQTYGANTYLSDVNVSGIKENGELGEVRHLDALSEEAMSEYFQWFVREGVSIDVVINCAGSFPSSYKHGLPAVEVSLEEFVEPLRSTTGTQFLSAREAYKVMSKQKKGVIIFITSTLAKVGSPWSPALSASHAATEGLMRSLANEWGAEGIRVLGVRSEAMPDSAVIRYTFETMGKNMGLSKDEMQDFIEQNKTALKRLPSAKETADVIALAASDLTGYMTGTMINNSGGHVLE